MSDKCVYGIDLGTTYSCLAKIDPVTGQPRIIEDAANGNISLPSAVAFPEDQEGVIVGAAAKEVAIEHPERVFQFFKRYMGRSDPNKPNYDPDTPSYNVDGKEYTPVDLSAIVLEQIKRYAAQQGEILEDVIITVPAYFSLDQRAATKDAGKIAGLNVLATINEPTAAALAFAQGQLPENRLMLVYDLGGGTFDVTMVRLTPLENNNYRAEVIVTDGNYKLGGFDWDERMFSLLKRKYADQAGISEDAIDPEDLNEIRSACEKTKQNLRSDRETTNLRVAGVKLTVTKDEFNAETADLLQQTIDLMEAMLTAARDKFGVEESQITDILMVGGSTRMPQVMDMLNNRFGADRVRFNDPERAVGLGAAVAYALTGNGQELDTLNKVIDKLGLDSNSVIRVDENGGVTVVNDDGTQTPLTDTEIKDLGIDDVISSGTDITVKELTDRITQTKKSEVVDVAPSTFGLIIRRNGEHAVDNVIAKGSVTGQTVTREYATPGGDYTKLLLPVVQSDSQNEYDPCQRDGDVYSFPGSTDRHQEVGRLEIPVPSALPEGSEVDVEISFDTLANLRIYMKIPAYGIEKELEINFGTSDEEIKRKREEHKKMTYIDAD